MKNKIILSIFFAVINFYGCEKTVIAYPGNNQDLDPGPPEGGIDWAIPTLEGKGVLEENSSSITIGTLKATDPNPDDEFEYSLTNHNNYFRLVSAEGITNLEVYGNINYEENIPTSKRFDLIINVTDDGVEPQSSDFTVSIDIQDVNETPKWEINPGTIYADVGLDMVDVTFTWKDTDFNQNPSFSVSDQMPEWLNFTQTENTATFIGKPLNSQDDGDFVVEISDEDFDVPHQVTVDVRENSPPVFDENFQYDNFPQFVLNHRFKVGCEVETDMLFRFIAKDPDNSLPDFNGIDNVEIDVEESIDWLNILLIDDGSVGPSLELVCTATPNNDDAANGVQEVSINLKNDRLDDESGIDFSEMNDYQLFITVLENSRPEFLFIDNLPPSIPAGETSTWSIDYVDPDEDPLELNCSNCPGWISYDVGTRTFTANPDSDWAGNEYSLEYTLTEVNNGNDSDGCYSSEPLIHSIVID